MLVVSIILSVAGFILGMASYYPGNTRDRQFQAVSFALVSLGSTSGFSVVLSHDGYSSYALPGALAASAIVFIYAVRRNWLPPGWWDRFHHKPDTVSGQPEPERGQDGRYSSTSHLHWTIVWPVAVMPETTECDIERQP
jgi:hypothetical protein